MEACQTVKIMFLQVRRGELFYLDVPGKLCTIEQIGIITSHPSVALVNKIVESVRSPWLVFRAQKKGTFSVTLIEGNTKEEFHFLLEVI